MKPPRWSAALIGVVMAGSVAPAGAWSNGPRMKPNGFGTHDWVLYAAVQMVEDEGYQTRWIHFRAARRATDDPDSKRDLRMASNHRWHNWGPYNGVFANGPKAVRFWYKRMYERLDHGNGKAASRALGIMSHLLSDLAQPMHTKETDAEIGNHLAYEDQVDARCKSRTMCAESWTVGGIPTWIFDGPARIGPYKRARNLIRHSKPWYEDLIAHVEIGPNHWNSNVQFITEVQLSKAINAIADLIIRISR